MRRLPSMAFVSDEELYAQARALLARFSTAGRYDNDRQRVARRRKATGLLALVREAFGDDGAERLTMAELVARLDAQHPDWTPPSFGYTEAANRLATALRLFGVTRHGSSRAAHYHRADVLAAIEGSEERAT